jgi:hypothetical protein
MINAKSGIIKLLKGEKIRVMLINIISRINIKKAYWLILPDCSRLTCLLNFKTDLLNPEGPKTSIKPLSTNL